MLSSVSECPHCGTALPASAPAGVCPRCLVARSLAPHDSAERAPVDFGDFVFEEMLGRGGMGAVFRARQKSLDREVALKLLPLELLEDEEFLERFEREARLMARLTHPGIARVFEAGAKSSTLPLSPSRRARAICAAISMRSVCARSRKIRRRVTPRWRRSRTTSRGI